MHKQIGNTIVQVTPTSEAITIIRSVNGQEVSLQTYTWEEAEHVKAMLEVALTEGKPKA